MRELNEFLESGILEIYVMGQANPEEAELVQFMADQYPEVSQELEELSIALEKYATENSVTPDPILKPFVMATLDYMSRLEQGEVPTFPATLHEHSKVEDYQEWLQRPDLQLQEPLNQIQAKIIGYTPQLTTAIIWLEHGAPPETHVKELETFLIVEGTCNIKVDDQDNYLQPGDVFSIPLHLEHCVIVTSAFPCKILLQRMAA